MVTHKKIYMDHAAATPMARLVFEAMKKYFSIEYGNPGSIHSMGVIAKKVVEDSRRKIATVLSARPQEIIFTSGGTESNNLAILGVAEAWQRDNLGRRGRIIVSAIEHKSVIEPARELERRGFELSYLPVSRDGVVDPNNLKKILKKNTILVSVMYANNEIGSIQPIKGIAKIIRNFRGENTYPYFHTDACQAPSALSLNVLQLGIDLMTLSGAKIYGPKGIGALYVKSGTRISSLIFGGGQEMGLRSGTENVPYIVGLAEALALAEAMRSKEIIRLEDLRNYFWCELKKRFPEVELNGVLEYRLSNNLNVYFPGCLSEQLVIELDAIGVEVSSGSACNTVEDQSSHVLDALGFNDERGSSSIRFSLGRENTKKEIDFILSALPEIINRIKMQ